MFSNATFSVAVSRTEKTNNGEKNKRDPSHWMFERYDPFLFCTLYLMLSSNQAVTLSSTSYWALIQLTGKLLPRTNASFLRKPGPTGKLKEYKGCVGRMSAYQGSLEASSQRRFTR
jgi:hypothetical protein